MNDKTKTTELKEEAVKTEEQPVETKKTEPEVKQEQPASEPKKDGWFKRNWKWVAGGAAAIVTAASTAVVAYKKGKAQSQTAYPMPQGPEEDYSLDPNVE